MPTKNEKNKQRGEAVDSLYRQGFTDTEIADIMGIPRTTAYRIRRYNLGHRWGNSNRGSSIVQTNPQKFARRLKKLNKQGYSDRRIALMTGVHRNTVLYHRKKMGLPTVASLRSDPQYTMKRWKESTGKSGPCEIVKDLMRAEAASLGWPQLESMALAEVMYAVERGAQTAAEIRTIVGVIREGRPLRMTKCPGKQTIHTRIGQLTSTGWLDNKKRGAKPVLYSLSPKAKEFRESRHRRLAETEKKRSQRGQGKAIV